MFKNLRETKGYLIELMIVVAIIAILAVVAIPHSPSTCVRPNC